MDETGGRMTAQPDTAERLPELRFRLPGTWWQVPLTDEAAARDSIRSLIREQIGRSDDQAALREAMTRRMLGALAQAIDGNGLSLQVALSIVEGVPLPVTMTVLLPEVGMTPAIGSVPAAVIGVLEQTLAAGKRLDAPKRFGIRESEVLRTHRLVESHESRPALVADYWVSVPGSKRVVLVSFSTALVDLADVLLEFFDSIVAASYWTRTVAPE